MTLSKKDSFRIYLEEAIGHENASVAFSALDGPASVSVRVNPFKQPAFSGAVPGDLHLGSERGVSGKVPWSPYGMFLSERPVFTLDPYFHGGAYYVQDSSAMFVGHVFRRMLDRLKPVSRPLRVLDLCAAPGGKTTDLAASLRTVLGDGFVLVANEVVRQRASVLAANVALWGDPCVIVTSEDPSRFAGLAGYFDIIVADVPCSGEGMFRKDAAAVEQWSEDNVRLCAGRQRRIVADVWGSLADNGILVYSTCTFNRYENDDNVKWISDNLNAVPFFHHPSGADMEFPGVLRTEYGFCLVPGLVKGEGQYCSALVKTGCDQDSGLADCSVPFAGSWPGYFSGNGRSGRKKGDARQDEKVSRECENTVRALFSVEVKPVMRNGLLKVFPAAVADEIMFIERNMHVLSSGCAVGEIKRDVLVPDADMALSLIFRKDALPVAGLDRAAALSFLQGNQIVAHDAPAGYLTVCYDGLPLGFVKNLGTRCNNLHPRGRRIRMDIGQ